MSIGPAWCGSVAWPRLYLIDVGFCALQGLAFSRQAGDAVEVRHLAARRVNAEVAVVTGAAVQVQAEVEALARGDGVRNLHDPRR